MIFMAKLTHHIGKILQRYAKHFGLRVDIGHYINGQKEWCKLFIYKQQRIIFTDVSLGTQSFIDDGWVKIQKEIKNYKESK